MDRLTISTGPTWYGMNVLEIRTKQAGDEDLALLIEDEECLWGQRAFGELWRVSNPPYVYSPRSSWT